MSGHSLSVTVDVEDWYHIPSVTGSPFSKYRDLGAFFDEWDIEDCDYLTEPTGRILRILKDNGITATFFIVADVANRYPGLVESIAAEGHEIACHGLEHSCNIDPGEKKPLKAIEEYETQTRKAKDILEKISGQKVIGYRAPNAYVAGWMIDSLEKIGFKYDSSVVANTLYNKSDSTLANVGTSAYYPKPQDLVPLEDGGRRDIIEFPWPVYKMGPVRFPTAGGPMLRFFGASYLRLGIDQTLKHDDTLFYFHPIDISDRKFPDVNTKGRPFYWMVKGNIVEKRVRSLMRLYKDRSIPLRERKELLN